MEKNGTYIVAGVMVGEEENGTYGASNVVWCGVVWFDFFYNKCITSNIGSDFLNLITKRFPNNSL